PRHTSSRLSPYPTLFRSRGCPVLTRETYCPKHKPESWPGRRGFEGYKGDWLKLRAQVLREEPFCRQCGRPATTVDHIIPKSQGGTDDRSNLQALCDTCRRRKDAADSAAGRRLARQVPRG